ncbi:alpha/beta fold hydrolase [Aestuariibaculum marinum]|uniref:Alpha/beta fold hydrolase n=1 Tax=Aestuariibaculum marinum TaxID=2683592 RepID=A0A8J6PUI6_9FLAO|nr:alpha/beta fold hydrolase [Aestuariibaculum marinum]MBD0824449.1 alpha/beta fold hydrolase [Aestuariibaculum marinum]
MRSLFTLNGFKVWILIVSFHLFNYSINAQDSSTKPTYQFVEIDGYKYHVRLGGQEHLEHGIPVVVLEAGFGDWKWGTIFDDIAKTAPVIAYERSGIGQSEWNEMEYTTLNVVNILRKILQKLELPPPYVLAGHSWGGVLIRTFAGHFPEEIKALVYIDSTDFTTHRDHTELVEMGVDTTGIAAFAKKYKENDIKNAQSFPPGYRAEWIYIGELFFDFKGEDIGLGSNPKIPIAVFVGTKLPKHLPAVTSDNPFEKAFFSMEYRKEAQKERIQACTEWISESPEGYLIVSPKAGHYFHLDEPQLVVEMIKRLIE